MVSADRIRAVCGKVAAESNPEDLEQLVAGLEMICMQYLRERLSSRRDPFVIREEQVPRARIKLRKRANGGPRSKGAKSND